MCVCVGRDAHVCLCIGVRHMCVYVKARGTYMCVYVKARGTDVFM
jgi:hypothetical protein